MSEVIYLDHAATSWPKPTEVIEAMTQCITEYGANPGRGSHQLSVKASKVMFDTRKVLSSLFHISNPNDIVFTLNTTHALNLAIQGAVKDREHIISTNIEHNSVRRPLELLKRSKDIDVTYLKSNRTGLFTMSDLENAVRPQTSLIILNHSSNLLGTIMPLEAVAEFCHRKQIKLLVDAAQTAGTLPIDVEGLGIDMLAFPGHKGLLGPQGTGGLYISPDVDLEPIFVGGTGSQSESIEQPSIRPDRYESGTQNTVGLAGLAAGVRFVQRIEESCIHEHEWKLTQCIMEGLSKLQDIEVLGPSIGMNRTGIVSFVSHRVDASELAHWLDKRYQIATRSGYHCTPLAHQTAGTFATGAVRTSVGYNTTMEDIDKLLMAVKEITALR